MGTKGARERAIGPNSVNSRSERAKPTPPLNKRCLPTGRRKCHFRNFSFQHFPGEYIIPDPQEFA
jgi:hypothetical protein